MVGRAAKDVPPLPRCTLFTLEFELVGAEGRLPRSPRFVSAGKLSKSGRCFGKLPAARSEPVAIAVSHMLSMGCFAQTGFFCASSRRLVYSGTHKLLAHQPRMAERRETILVASRPPLPPLRRAKQIAEGHLIVEGVLFLEGEDPGFFDDGDNKSAPGAFGCLDEPL